MSRYGPSPGKCGVNMDFLALAIVNLGIKPDQVLSHKIYDDHIALVIDSGIAGAKKVFIPFTLLSEQDNPAEAEAVKVDAVVDKLYGRQPKGRK
jgi:hypothetical protein